MSTGQSGPHSPLCGTGIERPDIALTAQRTVRTTFSPSFRTQFKPWH